ncbi:MAG TPA: universal stress protein [Labilithrix sp.]|nr:universal stress protein [Labilithrix sp.]
MNSRPATPASVPTVYLVAVDGTASSDHVVEVASGLGSALGGTAELHVMHILGMPASGAAVPSPMVAPTDMLEAGRMVLDRATTQAAARFKGKIIGHLGAGEAWREILQMASNLAADLVLVGTAGRTGLARLALGSVAEKVVRHAGCPVLVVRPKDYHARDGQEIEPPCPDCVATQKQTARAKLWCERHSTHHAHGRLHYELPASFGVGSMNFRP